MSVKTRLYKAVSLLLTLVMLIIPMEAFASYGDQIIYLCDGFGAYETFSHTPAGYEISDSTSAKIVKIGEKNKALFLGGESAVRVVRRFGTAVEGEFVAEFILKSDEKSANGSIGFVKGNNRYTFLAIENNRIVMNDRKQIGAISSAKTTEVTLIVDNANSYISVYLDGKCVADEWKLSSKAGSYDGVYVEKATTSGGIYIDELAVYSGKRINKRIKNTLFSNEKTVDMYLDQFPNNFTFFNSNYIVNASKNYLDTSLGAKGGNEIIAEPLDYQNVNKGDRIIFRKNDDDSTYNDVLLTMKTTLKSDLYPERYYYRNYCLEGDFLLTNTTVGGHMLLLIDNSVSPTAESSAVALTGGGGIRADGAERATVEANKWYHIAMYMNLDTRKLNLYLDGELIGNDLQIPDKINNISAARTMLYSGKGEMWVKDWVFTGLKYPMEKKIIDGIEVPTIIRNSQFPDDSAVRDYLKEKTVFHGDGNILYVNDKKLPMANKSVYDNDNEELYVSAEDFKTALGTEITYSKEKKKYSDGTNEYTAPEPREENGTMLIPATAIASQLGYYSVYLEYGKMVMVSKEDNLPVNNVDENKSWFDGIFYASGHGDFPLTVFTNVQEISNYIFYDRPDAEKLREDFNAVTNNGQMHPRIQLTPEKVNEMRELMKTDEEFRRRMEKIIETGESYLDMPAPEYKYSDGLRTLQAASDFERAITMAFCYQITGDKKFARRAIDDMLIVSQFPDYNPGHIIDEGMWLGKLGRIFDWCYDAMTEEERQKAADGIVKNGLADVNKAYYAELSAAVCMFGDKVGANYGGGSYFPKWKTNFIAYTQGGVMLAAMAIAEYAPEICFDTLEKALRSWEYSNFGFYSGGVWVEGKAYQNVVNGNMAGAFAGMMTVFEDDYNILEYPGVKENLDVLMNLSSLSGSFTYADENARNPLEAIESFFSFFSHYYKDERLARWRNYRIKNMGAKPTITDVIYYTPDDEKDPFDGLENTYYAPGGEFYMVHEDWNDKNALFFGMAGGPTRHYHFHNDGGDFLLCMDGEMWTHELGTGNYNLGTNYTRYSGRTEGHNTLVINPDENYSQAEQSYGEIIKYEQGEGGSYGVLDMTSLYAHHGATKVWRGSYISNNYDVVTIRDEMSFSKPANGYWFMHTKASMEQIDDNTILLSRGGKNLVLQFVCEGSNAKASMSIMDAKPLPTSPKLDGDQTASYNDVKKVAIYFEGSGDINLTVRMSALSGEVDTTPISQWKAPENVQVEQHNFGYDLYIDGQKQENNQKIFIPDGSYFPDFTLVPHDAEMNIEVEKIEELDKAMRVKIYKSNSSVFGLSTVMYKIGYDLIFKKDYVINKVHDYSVSATPEEANKAPNMFDEEFTTRWTGYNKGDYALIDLGESKAIDAVALGFWKGNERKYTITVLVSDDNENFKKVGTFTSNGESEMYEIFNFDASAKGRYVKIEGNGNTTNDVINILECRILTKR